MLKCNVRSLRVVNVNPYDVDVQDPELAFCRRLMLGVIKRATKDAQGVSLGVKSKNPRLQAYYERQIVQEAQEWLDWAAETFA